MARAIAFRPFPAHRGTAPALARRAVGCATAPVAGERDAGLDFAGLRIRRTGSAEAAALDARSWLTGSPRAHAVSGAGPIQRCPKCNNNSCSFGEKCGSKLDVDETYEAWDPKQTTSVAVQTPWGETSSRQKRGAPFINSRKDDFGGEDVGTDYQSFVSGLREGGKKKEVDPKIAKDLLGGTSKFLKTPKKKRSGAMLSTTVGVAEEWRKKGAAKIWRSLLRQVEKGSIDMDEAIRRFEFVKSADKGRRQIGRIQDVVEKRKKKVDLSTEDQEIVGNLSPLRDDDFSSEDEQRTKKTLKKKRLYSEKHALKKKKNEDDSDN